MEEHTVLAKKLLYRLIYGVVGVQFLLLVVDKFPVGLSLLSVVSHGIYAQNLRRFPVVKLTDPLFLLSCGMRNSIQRTALDIKLTDSSARHCKSLPLVPSLQCSACQLLFFISLRTRHEYSYIYRDRCILWAMRLARSLRSFRFPICWRERFALDGLRVRDRRWKQLYQPRKSARFVWKWFGRWSEWNAGKETGEEWDECGNGKSRCHWCQGVGWGNWRSHGILEGRENETYFLRAWPRLRCMNVRVMYVCYDA